MSITPADIRFILTGRSQDEIDEILDSELVKLFVLNSPAKDWAGFGLCIHSDLTSRACST
jgi:phthiodiolone/phenolphthiodiolone dimycocerosates ketoreductase